MMDHARNLEFEQAAAARDALTALKQRVLLDGAVRRGRLGGPPICLSGR